MSAADSNTLALPTYDEYGVGSPNGRFGYTGQAWIPEIGQYYYKARVYAPTLGRFLQTDPSRLGDGMNMYAYAKGDPINHSDPSGLSTGLSGPKPVDEVAVTATCWGTGVHACNPTLSSSYCFIIACTLNYMGYSVIPFDFAQHTNELAWLQEYEANLPCEQRWGDQAAERCGTTVEEVIVVAENAVQACLKASNACTGWAADQPRTMPYPRSPIPANDNGNAMQQCQAAYSACLNAPEALRGAPTERLGPFRFTPEKAISRFPNGSAVVHDKFGGSTYVPPGYIDP